MSRAQLKKAWNRAKTDVKFRRLLHLMLATLVTVPTQPRDLLAVCALADYTLRKAGMAGRRELRRRLRTAGWKF